MKTVLTIEIKAPDDEQVDQTWLRAMRDAALKTLSMCRKSTWQIDSTLAGGEK